jgi:hypothetical protein
MAATPDFRFTHRERDGVVVQDLTEWSGETEGMDRVESEWLDVASQDHVTGTVTEFGEAVSLGRETQEHLAEEWTDNAREAGIERIAFVSEGIKARAVGANLDVPQEIRTFKSVAEAVEWAGQ